MVDFICLLKNLTRKRSQTLFYSPRVPICKSNKTKELSVAHALVIDNTNNHHCHPHQPSQHWCCCRWCWFHHHQPSQHLWSSCDHLLLSHQHHWLLPSFQLSFVLYFFLMLSSILAANLECFVLFRIWRKKWHHWRWFRSCL